MMIKTMHTIVHGKGQHIKTHSQHMSSTVEGKFRGLLNDSSGKSVK